MNSAVTSSRPQRWSQASASATDRHRSITIHAPPAPRAVVRRRRPAWWYAKSIWTRRSAARNAASSEPRTSWKVRVSMIMRPAYSASAETPRSARPITMGGQRASDDGASHRQGHGMGPVAGPQSMHDQVHFLLDGALGVHQLLGDLGRGPALRQKAERGHVARRQPGASDQRQMGRRLGLCDRTQRVQVGAGKTLGAAHDRALAWEDDWRDGTEHRA